MLISQFYHGWMEELSGQGKVVYHHCDSCLTPCGVTGKYMLTLGLDEYFRCSGEGVCMLLWSGWEQEEARWH